MSDERAARIRLGMVGGGKDAFIGAVHRIAAARIDDQYELVAGALSSTADKARGAGAGARAGPRTRTTTTSATMAKREARRKNGIEAVAIVTPNHMHAPVASRVPEARHPRDLRQAADRDPGRGEEAREGCPAELDVLFVLTHNYTGYPMVRQARAMVADGAARGRSASCRWNMRRTGWRRRSRRPARKQAGWRTDPAQSGAGGSTGDIGTHAFNLGELRDRVWTLEQLLAADLQSFVPGRKLDDNGHVLLRFQGGGARHAVVQPGRHRQRERE